MTFIARRLLYCCAIIAFFIIGPLVILYATGFRFEMNAGRVTRVGAFYVKSYPANAQVFLNNKDTEQRTPARVLNLLPGIYTITVVKDTFTPWEKKLEIYPQETTFVRDIVLFYSSPQPRVLSRGGSDIREADDGTYYVFIDDEAHVILTNTESGNIYTIAPTIIPDQLLALSHSGFSLLYESRGRLYILDLNEESVSSVPFSYIGSAQKAVWDYQNATYLWVLVNQQLQLIDTSGGAVIERYEHVYDFVVNTQELVTLTRTPDATEIASYNLATHEQQWLSSISSTEPLILDSLYRDVVLVRGPRTSWLIHRAEYQNPQALNTHYTSWHNGKLLIATDFEVRIYNIHEGNTTFIDRTATPMRYIAWHPSGSYFLRQIGSTIELVEVDSRDRRNTVPIASVDQPVHTLFDKKGERLFLITTSTNSLYRIQ